jgi:hypothetical protein
VRHMPLTLKERDPGAKSVRLFSRNSVFSGSTLWIERAKRGQPPGEGFFSGLRTRLPCPFRAVRLSGACSSHFVILIAYPACVPLLSGLLSIE